MDPTGDTTNVNQSNRCTKSFRYVQSSLLLLLVITFMVYIITLIADIVAYYNQIGLLFLTLIIDLLALIILAMGIRGVALEIFHFVAAFAIVAAVVTICSATTFAFRSPLLTTLNFILNIIITVLGFLFAWMLYKNILSKGGATIIPKIYISKRALEDDKNSCAEKTTQNND